MEVVMGRSAVFGTATRGGWRLIALLVGCALLVVSCGDGETDRRGRKVFKPPPKVEFDELLPLQERLRAILAMPDMFQRVAECALFMETADPADLDAIRYVFETAPLDYGDFELVLFVEWWTRFDPETAFAWASFFWQTNHPRTAAAVVRGWARIDPEAAVEYGFDGKRLAGKPFMKSELIDALIVGWIESGEPGFLDFATSFPQHAETARALRAIARTMISHKGPEEALEWIRTVEGLREKDRNLLIGGAVTVTAGIDAPFAAKQAEELIASGVPMLGLYVRVANAWAKQDPVAMVEWVRSLPEGDERTRSLESGMRNWILNDKPSAVEWMRGQIGQTQAWEDWLMVELSRQEAIEAGTMAWLLMRWLIVDEAAAEAWLAEDDIVPENIATRARQTPPGPIKERVLRDYEKGQEMKRS
jgi:hypothetical protein